MTMRITLTSPVSSALGHIVFIDSQAQQPPSSSPLSAANLISAVPLYGSTTRMGSFRAACTARDIGSRATRAHSTQPHRLFCREPLIQAGDAARLGQHANLIIDGRRPDEL